MEGKVKDLVKALWEVDFEDKLTFRVIKYKEKGPNGQNKYLFIIKTCNSGIYDKEIFKALFNEDVIEEVEDGGEY